MLLLGESVSVTESTEPPVSYQALEPPPPDMSSLLAEKELEVEGGE